MDDLNSIVSVKSICAKKPGSRTLDEVNALVGVVEHCRPFMKIVKKFDLETLFKCCNFLQYLGLDEGQTIFLNGENADRYYIILKGKVKIESVNHETHLNEVFIIESGGFGESGLKPKKLRKFSATTHTQSHFLYLEKSHYLPIIQKASNSKRDSKVSLLKQLPIVNKWSTVALDRLQYFFKETHLNKLQKVYSEGDPAHSIFIIKQGTFELYKLITCSEKKSPPKATLVATYKRGEMFAEEDVFTGGIHQSTCKCAENSSVLLSIKKAVSTTQDFVSEMLNCPEFSEYFNARIARKTAELEKRKETRTAVQCLPKFCIKKLRKTKICQDLEKERKRKCTMFYPDTSDYAKVSKSGIATDRTEYLSSTMRKTSSNCSLKPTKIVKHNSQQILIKLLKSGKFLTGKSKRTDFKTLESLKITSLSKNDSSSSPIKALSANDSKISPLKVFKTS